MTFELFADARTELDGAASLLTDVLGVGSAREREVVPMVRGVGTAAVSAGIPDPDR